MPLLRAQGHGGVHRERAAGGKILGNPENTRQVNCCVRVAQLDLIYPGELNQSTGSAVGPTCSASVAAKILVVCRTSDSGPGGDGEGAWIEDTYLIDTTGCRMAD